MTASDVGALPNPTARFLNHRSYPIRCIALPASRSWNSASLQPPRTREIVRSGGREIEKSLSLSHALTSLVAYAVTPERPSHMLTHKCGSVVGMRPECADHGVGTWRVS